MKKLVQRFLQSMLGFQNYLFVFSLFKIFTLKYDKNEKDFFYFLKQIPPTAFVLDIGANIGIMSYFLSKNAGLVWSFEPIPTNLRAFRKVITFFSLKNVQVFDLAIGTQKDTIKMVLPKVQGVKMQGLSHVLHPTITEFNEGDEISVEQISIDELFENNNMPLAAIKIDVENYEYFALKGAEKTLNKYKPIIYCELWDNKNRTLTFELMQNLGYQVYYLREKQLTLFDKQAIPTQNFFFIHTSKSLQ